MLNRLFIAVGFLVIMVIGAAFVVPRLITWSDYRDRLETMTSEAFGAPVTINGEIQFTLLPQPQLILSDVVAGDPAAPALRVARVEAEVPLVDFLRDQYSVSRLLLTSPEIAVTIGADGALTTALALAPQVGETNISIAEAAVADGRVVISDARSSSVIDLGDIDGEIKLESLRGPVSFQGSGEYERVAYGVRLSTGRTQEDGATPLSLFVRAGDDSFNLGADGQVTAAAGKPRFTGTMTLRMPPAKPAEGEVADAGRGDLVLEGKVDAQPDRVLLSDYALAPDENRPGTRLSGAIEIMLGTTPRFNAVMSGGVVALPPRDATAELTDPPYEFVRLLGEVPLPPIPPMAGTLGLDIAEINLRGTSLREVRVDASTDGVAWDIKRMSAGLPGNGRASLTGDLSVVDGKPVFAGQLTATANRLDLLSQLWRKPAAGNPLFNLEGGLAGNVRLSSDTLTLSNATLTLGDLSQPLEAEVGFAPTARHLNITALFPALSAEQSRAIAALVPEIAGNGSFAATFPKGQVELSAVSATVFDLEARSLALSANWDGGVLDVTKLSAADFGGASIEGSFTAFGTLLKPELSGQGSIKVGADAPIVASAFTAMGVVPALQDSLRRQLPADLAVELTPPTGEGGQGVKLNGAIAAANLALDAQLSGGIFGAFDNPLTLSVELDSAQPSAMTAQLGLGQGQLFPEDQKLRLIATLGGAPRETLDARFTLEGGEDIVSFAGNLVAADPERVTGSGVVQATLGEPAPLLEALGAGGLAVPQLTGTATLEFAGGDSWRLGQIEARASDVPFTGLMSMTRNGETAAVDGRLDFATFDAAAILPFMTGRSGAVNLGTGVWPDNAIDIGVEPRSVTGRVAIRAENVTAGGTPFLTDAGLVFDWDEQSIRLRDFEGKAGEGTFSLDAQVCCSGPLPDKRLTGRVAITGADLDFLAPAPVRPVLDGTVDASAQFDGSGANLTAMIATMSGSGSYTIRDFRAEQLDPDAFTAASQFENVFDMDDQVLESQLRDRVKRGSFTASETTGTFTVAGGTLRSPNLAIDGPAARLFGGLSLKLSDLMLEGRYGMTPVAIVEAATGIDPSAEIAINITGPLWAPVAMLDVSGLASGMKLRATEDELARLEQLRAEDEARQAAAAAEAERLAAEQAAAEEAARVAAEQEAARQAAEAAAAAEAAEAEPDVPEPFAPLDLGL